VRLVGACGDDSFITPMLVEGVIQTLLRAARHDHSHAVAEATTACGDAAARQAVALDPVIGLCAAAIKR
jgi:hypothetical protein